MGKFNTNQSINSQFDQSIRNFTVPYRLEKDKALNIILDKINSGNHPEYSKSKIIKFNYKIAVAIAAVFFLFFGFYFVTDVKTITAVNEVAIVRLPDNSRVVLEKGGEIIYGKYFWNRKLKLSGSAYFEVVHGEKFLVITDHYNVEVLGTRFSIENSREKFRVECFEGAVKTSVSEKDAVVKAGSFLEGNINDSNDLMIQSGDKDYPQFALFEYGYNNAQLSAVINDLNDFFNVNIQSKIKDERKFSGKLSTGKLEIALEILCASMGLEMEFVNEGEIIIK